MLVDSEVFGGGGAAKVVGDMPSEESHPLHGYNSISVEDEKPLDACGLWSFWGGGQPK